MKVGVPIEAGASRRQSRCGSATRRTPMLTATQKNAVGVACLRTNVRYRTQIGNLVLIASLTAHDPERT
jgi:hypothetical protein